MIRSVLRRFRKPLGGRADQPKRLKGTLDSSGIQISSGKTLLGHVDFPVSGQSMPPLPVRISGWAVDAQQSLLNVLVRINDSVCMAARTGLPRPDVAAAHPDLPGSAESGWEADVDLRGLAGSLEVTAIAVRADGSWRRLALLEIEIVDDHRLMPGEGFIDPSVALEAMQGEWLRVTGWALAGSPVTRVEILVDERPVGPARLGLPRPDVAGLSPLPEALISGFEHDVDLSAIRPEAETIRLGATVHDFSEGTFRLPDLDVSLSQPPLPIPADLERGEALRERNKRMISQKPPHRRTGIRVFAFTPTLGHNGVGHWLLNLMGRLSGVDGFFAGIVSLDDGPIREKVERLGIPVHITSMPTIDPASYEGQIVGLATWAEPFAFDLGLMFTVSPLLGGDLVQRMGIPLICAVAATHDMRKYWKEYFKTDEVHPYVRERAFETLKRASLLTFPSVAALRAFQGYADQSRCLVIPNGVDTKTIDSFRSRLDRAASRYRLGIPEGAVVVITAGSMSPLKGLTLLAEAFGSVGPRHPEAMLIFLGDDGGEYSRALRNYLARAELLNQTRVIPRVPNPFEWYGIADLYVSASDFEGGPIAVREAMAFGLPIIAAKAGDVDEIVQEGTSGYLCEPRDLKSLADALDRALLADPEERRIIGAAAAHVARERLDSEKAAGRFLRLMTILTQHPHASPEALRAALSEPAT